jgi:large subunit ribosomal protein L3
MKGIIGKKIGMTQTFSEKGDVQPVTLVEAGPCVITQIKTETNDGYNAVQIGFETLKRANKPISGHLQRTGNYKYLREIRVETLDELQVGQLLNVEMFDVGERIRVTANSKGRGFAGGMKRHGFHGGPKTHGQSDRWRAPGSIGAGSTPGRVFKGKRMAGHFGDEAITTRGLEVVFVDLEKNLLAIKGAVPGASNGLVLIAGEGYFPIIQSTPTNEVEEVVEEVTPTNEVEEVVEEVTPTNEVEEVVEKVTPTNEVEEER